MAIDVTDILCDPDLADTFSVTRKKEVISSKGRSTVPSPAVTANVVGVVTAASPNDLERLDDSQRMGNNICIVTTFMLRGPAKDGSDEYQPDTVTWRGNDYLVKTVDNYPQFGPGFVQAIAGSVEIIDNAVE